MRCLTKIDEPNSFISWKALANEDWQPTYSDLQNPQKEVLHNSLLREQGFTCCYCGRRVSLHDSHIEHFRPQSAFKELELDYSNLHASCIKETNPGHPLHCGHGKGNDFDADMALSPLDGSCARRFMYSIMDGAIFPTDEGDKAATYMIQLLQISAPFLKSERAEVLGRTFDEEFLANASPEDIEALARAFRTPDANGYLESFAHVIARYAEQQLQRHIL